MHIYPFELPVPYYWTQALFIPVFVEGYFYGLYTAVFVLYFKYQASQQGIRVGKSNNILLYSLCILYVLSTTTFAVDVATFFRVCSKSPDNQIEYASFVYDLQHLYWISTVTTGLCDFISQAILIYRCWVVWGGNARIIIFPSILAATFLTTWVASIDTISVFRTTPSLMDENFIAEDYIFSPSVPWKYLISLVSLALSLTVNAIVTALIVFRIVKVYREVRPTLEDERSGVSGGASHLRSVIFVIIESGMMLFAIQLFRVCITVLWEVPSFRVVIGINQMLNGITPTIILVRVAMKLSYHDEKSLVDAACSLRFASHNNEDSISETERIGIVDQDSEEMHGVVGIQQKDGINVEEREACMDSTHTAGVFR